jgi:predicted cobalt transporter CbtA
VAAGNIVLVLVFEWIIRRIGMDKGRGWISVGGASVLKSLFLWGAIAQFFVRFLLPAQGLPAEKTAAMTAALSLNFSWPQLVTALIGGAVALVVLPAVRRALHAEEQLPR